MLCADEIQELYKTSHEERCKGSHACHLCDGEPWCERREHKCADARHYFGSKDRNWKRFRKSEYK